jgi:hypothetical protein
LQGCAQEGAVAACGVRDDGIPVGPAGEVEQAIHHRTPCVQVRGGVQFVDRICHWIAQH